MVSIWCMNREMLIAQFLGERYLMRHLPELCLITSWHLLKMWVLASSGLDILLLNTHESTWRHRCRCADIGAWCTSAVGCLIALACCVQKSTSNLTSWQSTTVMFTRERLVPNAAICKPQCSRYRPSARKDTHVLSNEIFTTRPMKKSHPCWLLSHIVVDGNPQPTLSYILSVARTWCHSFFFLW